MKININTDQLAKSLAALQALPERANRTLSTALTRSAQAVRAEQVREMRDVFDRPTPFTLNAVYVRGSQASTLQAEVGIKNDGPRAAAKWLRWNIFGGSRTLKAFERALVAGGAMRPTDRAVPARFAKLDGFGNIPGSVIVQILSQLRIDTTVGSTRSLPRITASERAAVRNAELVKLRKAFGPVNVPARKSALGKARRINSAYKRAGGQYVAFPNGRGKLVPGVYQIRQFAFGRSDPKPVMIFVPRARYEAERFDFFFVAQQALSKALPQQLDQAVAETVALLRSRAAP